MKFGYFCNITNWDHEPYSQVINDVRDIAKHCDENHWDSIWLTEHHLNHESMDTCPNPLMLGADIASRTQNIRIGQATNIINFWNPLQVAEDIAMLDQMFDGRIDCGVEFGSETVHMDVDADADLKEQAKNSRLFEESLSIMKKAWTRRLFDHQDEFYQYPAPNFNWQQDISPPNPDPVDMKTNQPKKIGITPRPLQSPHPPLWQVVDSHRSIEQAGRNGLNAVMWIPTVKALKECFEVYRNARSETEGRDVPLGEGISLVRDMFIADSMDEARELAGEGIIKYLSWIAHWRGPGNHMDPGEVLPETQGKLDLLTYEFLHPRNMLFGTADYVSEKIEELQDELNLQHLQVWSNFPGVSHDKVMNSVRLFSEQVMPRFSGLELSRKYA